MAVNLPQLMSAEPHAVHSCIRLVPVRKTSCQEQSRYVAMRRCLVSTALHMIPYPWQQTNMGQITMIIGEICGRYEWSSTVV